VNSVTTASASAFAFADNDVTVFEQTAGGAGALLIGGTATITDFTNVTQVLAYLDEAMTIAASDVGVVVLNNGTNSYAYYVNDADTGGDFDAGEVVLIGAINNAVMTAASWSV